jgi:effector-binding domain-containing protein
MATTEPKIEHRGEQNCVGIRTQVSMDELGNGIIPQLHDEVLEWLNEQGEKPSGQSILRYYVINMPGRLDIEMVWPVAKPVTGNGRIQATVLPAGQYGFVVYTGDYSGLMEANRVLVDWAKEQGVEWDAWDEPAGHAFRCRYETYLKDPGDEPDSNKWVTEVAIKIAD